MNQPTSMTDTVQLAGRKLGGGGGSDRYILELLVNLPDLGLWRGDCVEAKSRTGIQFGRLMMAEIGGKLHFGRFYPHSCASLRFERAGGETRMIPSDAEFGKLGIVVLSTRMTAYQAREKWGLPELPEPEVRRRKGAK